jgi:alpha-galactosidase
MDPALLKKTDDPRTRFTLSLLSNDEVIEVNQDELGQQARRVKADGVREVWVKELADGSRAVGLFNRSPLGTVSVEATWDELGLKGAQEVRDLWRQKELGSSEGKIELEVKSHGVMLIRVRPK